MKYLTKKWMNESEEYAHVMSMLAMKGYNTLEEWKSEIEKSAELAARETAAAEKRLSGDIEFDELVSEEIRGFQFSDEVYINFRNCSLRIADPEILERENADTERGKMFLAALELSRGETKEYELRCLIKRETEKQDGDYFYLTVAGNNISVVA